MRKWNATKIKCELRCRRCLHSIYMQSSTVVTLSIEIRLHKIMAFYFVDISCAVILWKNICACVVWRCRAYSLLCVQFIPLAQYKQTINLPINVKLRIFFLFSHYKTLKLNLCYSIINGPFYRFAARMDPTTLSCLKKEIHKYGIIILNAGINSDKNGIDMWRFEDLPPGWISSWLTFALVFFWIFSECNEFGN